MMTFLDDVLDLAFPRACVACGEWGSDLCRMCRSAFGMQWHEVSSQAQHLLHYNLAQCDGADEPELTSIFPVYTRASYEGVVRDAILAWKHNNLRQLEHVLIEAWTAQVDVLRMELAQACIGGGQVLVVPAPSNYARRHRNQLVAAKLARALAHELRVECSDVLRKRFAWQMQLQKLLPTAGYRVAQKEERRSKSQQLKCLRNFAHSDVLLVDDVLTTGATLAGCARILAAHGATVRAAVVLASAPARK